MARVYGEIRGYPLHAMFGTRAELAASGVHRPLQAGISGGKDGADSIVVSGGYVDDEDYGYEIIYTGQGGNDPGSGRQIADQHLTRGNAGLARSHLEGNPVRVVRGAGGDRLHSPASGFRYDGLYRVVEYWHEAGQNGFRIWRFRLVSLGSGEAPTVTYESSAEPVSRVEAHLQRLVRNTSVASHVKELHRHHCQACGLQLATPAGPYSEAAHIRALGRPHNGPDVESNVLCLCPNHHVLFDTGAIYVDMSWRVLEAMTGGIISELRTVPSHVIDEHHLAYHRDVHTL